MSTMKAMTTKKRKKVDESKLTTEQMQSLRVVLITKNREKQLDKMRELIYGEDDFYLMKGNTSFSNNLLASWKYTMKKRLSGMKDPSKKLDVLFAYLFTMHRHDFWMHDNEGDMGELIREVASAWKRHLTRFSDEELGWDLKYTKPGMLELLNSFKRLVEEMPDYCKLGKFNYH